MPANHHGTPIQQVSRLFTILHLLASRRSRTPLGRAELAEACQCCPKTISRDIQTLRDANIGIEYDPRQRAYFLSDTGWAFSLLTFTDTDALALALARCLLGAASEAAPFAEETERTLAKAMVGLSPAQRMLVDAASCAIADVHGLARDYSRAPLRLLALAAARQITVEMRYASQSGGSCRWRRVDPYRLDRREGRYLELQAWCHERRTVRTFALDRVEEAKLTGARFVRQKWDPEDMGVVGGLRGEDWVEVVARFDARVAAYARARRWPFAATFEDTGDGGVILRGQVRGTVGMVRELLSWRRHVQVLGGPELRRQMEADVRALCALYASPAEKNSEEVLGVVSAEGQA